LFLRTARLHLRADVGADGLLGGAFLKGHGWSLLLLRGSPRCRHCRRLRGSGFALLADPASIPRSTFFDVKRCYGAAICALI
jgi:hypothetical protein